MEDLADKATSDDHLPDPQSQYLQSAWPVRPSEGRACSQPYLYNGISDVLRNLTYTSASPVVM